MVEVAFKPRAAASLTFGLTALEASPCVRCTVNVGGLWRFVSRTVIGRKWCVRKFFLKKEINRKGKSWSRALLQGAGLEVRRPHPLGVAL